MYRVVVWFFLHDVFLGLSPMFAMFSAFMFDSGLNPMMIAVCFSTFFIATSIFELPSSVIADKFSRKKVIMVSDIVAAIGTGVMLLSRHEGAFIACLVISAIAFALKSGTADALLYDELKNKNLESTFPKAFGIYQSAVLIGIAFGLMIASYTISYGYIFTVVVAICGILIALLVLALFIDETPKIKEVHKEYSLKEIFYEAKNTVFAHNYVLYMAVMVAAYSSVVMAFGDIAIVTSMSLGWEKENIARVCSYLTFVNIAVMFVAARYISKLTVRIANIVLFAALLFPAIGMFFGAWWSIFFVFPVWWCSGINEIAVRTRIQKYAASTSRATVTSVISLITGVFYIASTLMLGYIAMHYSYAKGIMVIAVIMSSAMILIFYKSRNVLEGVK
jgi:MFS family permease